MATVMKDGKRWEACSPLDWFGDRYLCPSMLYGRPVVRLRPGVQTVTVIRPDWSRAYRHGPSEANPLYLVQWPDEGTYALVRRADGTYEQCSLMSLGIRIDGVTQRETANKMLEELAD